MKLTPARRRMLAALQAGSRQKEILFMETGSHASGYAPLRALVRAGLVETSVSGSYLTGSDPVMWCAITPAGRAALGEQ